MEQLGTYLLDKRVNSKNFIIELTIREYYELIKNNLGNNEFQRSRITSSKTIYSLLKEDLKKGCLIPSIVLALPNEQSEDKLIEEIQNNKNDLIILDGLQRTYTICDLVKENDKAEYLDTTKLRIEVYTNLSKSQVLYRMLTLNTGHTPMSTRHQIEIVYFDLKKSVPDNIKIFTDTDKQTPNKIGEYSYKDVIDGYSSLMEGDYLPIDRIEILNTVKRMDELNHVTEQGKDIFTDFIVCYNNLAVKINTILEDWTMSEDIEYTPYAKNIPTFFRKAQTLAGFGAALSSLFATKELENFVKLNEEINNLVDEKLEDGLISLNDKLEYIRPRSKKIGNDQRYFLYWFFKNYLNPSNETFLRFNDSVDSAFDKYKRDNC